MKNAATLLATGFLISLVTPAYADRSCTGWITNAFFSAASVEVVRDCLEASSSLTERDNEGRTPLHLAAAVAADPAVIGELLRAGADPATPDAQGRRAIHVAAASARTPDVLTYLLVWGSDAERELPNGKRCSWRSLARCATVPLHLAAKRPDGASHVAALLAAGANPDLRDIDGRSALQHAAESAPNTLIISVLLQAGAAVDVADFEGLTPLHAAVRRTEGAHEIVSMLLAAGASADAGDSNGTTPLIWGARSAPDAAIVEMLIEAADDPCVADSQERTALSQWDLNENLDRDGAYWRLHDRCSE